MGSIQETSETDKQDGTPKLFQPLQIRGLHLRNRIVVSPMGMYSSYPDGKLTDFHLMHHGQFAFRGAALTMVEVTAVTPTGRSSPSDAGLWSDAQIPSFKRVVDFVHSLEPSAGGRAKIGIQLGHAGRKASMMPIYPGHPVVRAKKEDGGWPEEVLGPSAVPFKENYVTPREMSEEEMQDVVEAFAAAAKRAVIAGFDLIELHAAHGYLLSSFLSAASNPIPFSSRTHLLLSTVRAVRAALPASIPLSIRISATDWLTHAPTTPQSTLQDALLLAPLLADAGVDILDVSSGGNSASQKIPTDSPFYQIDLAAAIKAALVAQGKDSMLVAAVGRIVDAQMAERVVSEKGADLAFVGTQFLREAGLVWGWARELGVRVEWPRQYVRGDAEAVKKLGTL